jgi:peptidoglycan hydrolase-like protein with peptidoglycan-binding domain
VYPLKAPYDKITTPYGKRGKSWGCNKNASGEGVHTGIDLSAPKGTLIYAPCDGQIRHRDYGNALGEHQFAISPDKGQAFADGEIFFAHTQNRLADGVYVKMGQQIAMVGDEGNVTGPHLHMEYHPTEKNSWNCHCHADPKPVLAHGAVAAAGAPYVTAKVYRSKCGFGEPTNGDTSSDTIKELQERLKRAGLSGGVTLAVDGRYGTDTDLMVRLWQEQVCDDTPDTLRKSYLGPNQFKTMFPDATYELIDDGNPKVASPPSTTISEMGKRFQRVNKYVTAPVRYEYNWDNDIIAGDGSWSPSFFVLHHTAIPSDPDEGASSLAYIMSGAGYAPVRLCNWLVDRDGDLHVISARKSYHAGIGEGFGVADNSMNSYSAGVEIESMGKAQDFTDAQILTVSQLATGWFEEFKIDDSKALNHKDWSSTGKKDTLYTMAWWRTQFKAWNAPPVIEPEPPIVIEPEPPIVEPPEPEKTITFPLGIEYWFSGKPAGTLTVGTEYKRLDVKSWAPKKDGLTFGMLYVNVDPTFTSGKTMGVIRARIIREAYKGQADDPTAYKDFLMIGGWLITHVWFEAGEAGRPLHWELVGRLGTSKAVIGTRYAKFVTIPWLVTIPGAATAKRLTEAVTATVRKWSHTSEEESHG